MKKSWFTLMIAAGLGAMTMATTATAAVSVSQLKGELKAGQYANVIKEVNTALPQSTPVLAAALYMVKGEALVGEKKFTDAALAYLRVPFCYPQAFGAPEALLRAAQIEARQLKDPAAAVRILQQLVRTYPRTVQALQAKHLLAGHLRK